MYVFHCLVENHRIFEGFTIIFKRDVIITRRVSEEVILTTAQPRDTRHGTVQIVA